jgi:cytochrome c oxidase subunit 2
MSRNDSPIGMGYNGSVRDRVLTSEGSFMGTAGGSNKGVPRCLHAAGLALLALAAFGACDGNSPSTLDSKGPAASRIEGQWWLMFWISAAVFIVVVVMLLVALRRRKPGGPDSRHVRWGEPFIVVAGVIIPAVILFGVFVVALRDMAALSAEGRDAELTIDIIGHDWWWEAVYPESGAVTANEIHIPVGVPVRLRLTTDDVIHSFWVPQLQAKTDMVPGKTNEMWLQADEPGRYRGQCAEFCGLQHANMIFYVVAEARSSFDSWLISNSRPAPEPVTAGASEGMEVFLSSTCVGCHAIRGTEADSDVGPDLTHVAGRETIAAGVLPNTRADLATWIVDPQGVKPGTVMPPTELSSEELDALLDYLEQLE